MTPGAPGLNNQCKGRKLKMGNMSTESIKAELDARKIGYSDEMSYKELGELLKKAKDEEAGAEAAEAMEPLNTDMADVKCGVSTIQDHEMRLRVIERQLVIKRE